jgi:hypothetical protein
LLAIFAGLAFAEDLTQRVLDRAAIERVYASHRIGAGKSPEPSLSTAKIERLVRDDATKEATLRRVYQVAITPAQIDAEAKRIDSTTRAPGMLAEIKRALGDDPARFVGTVVRPIVVDRELRRRFENDDALHAAERHLAAEIRDAALAAQKDGTATQAATQAAALRATKAGTVNEVAWILSPRTPQPKAAPPVGPAPGLPALPIAPKSASSPPSTESSGRAPGPPEPRHFDELPPELQRVLAAQLQKPGDVSALIETPAGFLVFVAQEKTAELLRAASFFLPKRSYEEWLAQQPPE